MPEGYADDESQDPTEPQPLREEQDDE